MISNSVRWVLVGLFVCAALGSRVPVQAQTFGIELHNNLMPASGGMGGVSIAQPQDVTSGINGNPASLTQFAGTQFSFGGAWAEPTFNMNQRAQIPALDPSPLIEPYSAKSTAPGVAAANIGVTQDFSALGLPATSAIGFITSSGSLVDFRHVPESNATNAGLAVFSVPVAVGLDVTERLSLGTSMALGIGFFDGPFVGTGGMTTDYALRGVLGANYRLADCTTLGTYYQTQQSFRFDNAFIIDRPGLEVRQNVDLDLPQNVGFGIADHSLANGRLLVGIDVLYKMWDDTDLFGAIYDDQWVVQLGSQYTLGRMKLRAGYAWAENPIDSTPGSNIGGVVQPGDVRAVRYTQGLLAVTSQHRIAAGIGVADLLPGIDLDVMAGGMFKDDEQLGDFTTTSIESYWVGFGLTWRFGRGACCQRLPVPDHWH